MATNRKTFKDVKDVFDIIDFLNGLCSWRKVHVKKVVIDENLLDFSTEEFDMFMETFSAERIKGRIVIHSNRFGEDHNMIAIMAGGTITNIEGTNKIMFHYNGTYYVLSFDSNPGEVGDSDKEIIQEYTKFERINA